MVVSAQPRWPRGTPVGPDGHGPGGGRWMGEGLSWAELAGAAMSAHHGIQLGMGRQAIHDLLRDPPAPRHGPAKVGVARDVYREIGDSPAADETDHVVTHEIQMQNGEWLPISRTTATNNLYNGEPLDAEIAWREVTQPYTERFLGGGAAAVFHRKYDDGRQVIIKRHSMEDAAAEYLTSLVADAIGAPAPAAETNPDRPTETWMGFVEGLNGVQAVADRPLSTDVYDAAQEMEAEWAYREPGWRIALLDLLTDNRDRHIGNWMVDADWNPVAIDHNRSWGGGANIRVSPVDPHMPPSWLRDYTITQALLTTGGGWDTQWLTPQQAEQIDRRLRMLQPEFERLHKQDWYGYVIQSWEAYHRAMGRPAPQTVIGMDIVNNPDQYIGAGIFDHGRWDTIVSIQEGFVKTAHGQRIPVAGQAVRIWPIR